MFQPVIHLGYFFELQLIQQDIEQIDKEFQEMTKKIVAEFKTTETLQDSTQVRNLANSSHESKKKYEMVLASFYQSKIFESFLEGAPQSILQLTIVLQTGEISSIQWFAIATSFLSVAYSSSGIFLQHPTKVFSI